MSIYSNVTEEDMINLRNLAQQQKEQRAEKNRNKILKQTHDKNEQKVFHLLLKN